MSGPITDAINTVPGGNTGQKSDDVTSDSLSGDIFLATVTEVLNLANELKVSASKGLSELTCIYIPNIFTKFIGISLNYLPPIGETVLCLKDPKNEGFCYALGVVPSNINVKFATDTNFIDPILKETYSGVSGEYKDQANENGISRNSGAKPADLVDGEVSLTSPSGAGISILSNLARLKASELAFVETFIQDDMVRIMSMNYEHLHAAGEQRVVINQGLVDQVTNITDTEQHSINSPENNLKFRADGKYDLETNKKDNPDANYYLDGKWLLTDFKGKLGNVISGWIKCPEVLLSLDPEKDSHQSARARYHFNQDGTFVLQSLGDIIIEKVSCIPVPQLNKKRLDEIYDISKRELKYYAEWVPTANPSVDEYGNTLYKIRDYARYLTNYLTLAEFRAQSEGKDSRFYIPKDTDIMKPLPSTGASSDAVSLNEGAYQKIWDNYLVYSTARFMILRNGDVAITDNSGNSLSMNIHGITLSSSTNMNINVAGSLNVMAGQDINILARENIDISAVLRGVIIKANRWLEAFCWKGPALLQSDFVQIPEFPTEEERKNYLKGYAGDDADTDTDYLRRCNNAKSSAVTIKSSNTSDVQLVAGKGEGGNIIFKAANSIFTSAKSFLNKLTDTFGISNWFKASQGEYINGSASIEVVSPIFAPELFLRRAPSHPIMEPKDSNRSLVFTTTNPSMAKMSLDFMSSDLNKVFPGSVSNASFSYRQDDTSGATLLVENLTQQTLRIWTELDKTATPPNIKAENLSWKSEDLFSNKWLGDKTIGYPWPKGFNSNFILKTYNPVFTNYTKSDSPEALCSGKFNEVKSFNWIRYEGVKSPDKQQS